VAGSFAGLDTSHGVDVTLEMADPISLQIRDA